MFTLKILIDKAYNALLESGLKEKTVYSANWYIWNRLNQTYGEETVFEDKMVYEYCLNYFKKEIFVENNSNLSVNEKRYKLAFNRLIHYYKFNKFEKNTKFDRTKYKLDDTSLLLLNLYIEYSRNEGNNSVTISNKTKVIRNFMIDTKFPDTTSEKLKEYLIIRQKQLRKNTYVIDSRLLRKFLLFCYIKGSITKEILISFPEKMKNIQNNEIPSAYTPEEISVLLKNAKNYKNEDNHLRNYAILSLITYSGLRKSDVSNMKLTNIDWRNNFITIIQQKNKKKHTIPLIAEIGNPILNYIKNERKGSSEYVFLTEKGGKLLSYNITIIINNYFASSSIDINGRHYGPHALRHSLATNLLNNSMHLFEISNVLGHSDTSSVKIYAKLDINNLKKCVLEAPYRA